VQICHGLRQFLCCGLFGNKNVHQFALPPTELVIVEVDSSKCVDTSFNVALLGREGRIQFVDHFATSLFPYQRHSLD
jgi:hypothetical protein